MQSEKQSINSESKREELYPSLVHATIHFPLLAVRASAYPAGVAKIRPRYLPIDTVSQDADVTRIPTVPQPTLWQHESSDYAAQSSLSTLSLVPSRRFVVVVPEPAIDEVDTVPPIERRVSAKRQTPYATFVKDVYGYYHRQSPVDISERVTHPPLTTSRPRRLFQMRDKHYCLSPVLDDVIDTDTVLSSTVLAALPVSFQPQASSVSPAEGEDDVQVNNPWHLLQQGHGWEYRPAFAFLDRVRWWLVSPGRIELLLLVISTVFLMILTGLFVFMMTLSLAR